jgi:hypothetical protein
MRECCVKHPYGTRAASNIVGRQEINDIAKHIPFRYRDFSCSVGLP